MGSVVMEKPKISVIMAVFNGGSFLRSTIASVLEQSYNNFEFIIIDDASTDLTKDIIEEYLDNRIKYFRNSSNLGLTVNLNFGLKIASGKYIARLDADDICLPNRFGRQVEFLETNGEIDIVGSNALLFGDSNGVTNLPLTHDVIKCELLFHCCMIHPSVMMRKSALGENGLMYNEDFKKAQDYDMWVRGSRNLKIANIREPLIKYRRHRTQISQVGLDNQNNYANITRCNQLKELGIILNENENRIFLSYISGQIHKTEDFFLTLENIFKMILFENEKRGIFNQIVLSQVLGRKWYSICASEAKQLSNLSKLFWKSDLQKYAVLSKYEKTKMKIGSIFSYK